MTSVNPVSRAPLVGIARMASESERLLEKRVATYFEMEAKSILNRCSNEDMPFYWTINPFRGCEFGCKYCYARYTHEYMGMEDGADFEQKIYIDPSPWVLRQIPTNRPSAGF